MIKDTLRNFGKNILYVFIPMGIVYLFIILAIFTFLGTVLGSFSSALQQLTTLIGESVDEAHVSITDALNYSLSQIDWHGNILAAIKQVIDTNWLQNTLINFFETLNVSVDGFEAEFTSIITTFKETLVAQISVALSMCVAGVTFANYVTRFILRRKVARRNLKKFIIAHIFEPLLEAGCLIGFLALASVIKMYSLLVMLAFVLFVGFTNFAASWLVFSDNRISLKEVLTTNNMLKYYAAIGVVLLINVAIAALVALINVLLAILIMVPVVIYSINVVNCTTDSFVDKLAAENAAKVKNSDDDLAGNNGKKATESDKKQRTASPRSNKNGSLTSNIDIKNDDSRSLKSNAKNKK